MSDTLTKLGVKKPKEKAHFSRKSGSGRIANKKSDNGIISYVLLDGGVDKVHKAAALIEAVKIGLPFKELRVLQASLNVGMEQLIGMIGISKATLHRRMAHGKLGAPESERVVRFAKLMGRAVEVLESEDNARQWLRSPQFGLGGAVPLEYATTELGAREVEDLLGRIEYGVYS
jgi:putative toxin-antitoxin system antitoxin component (TIGR02293 family)